MTLLAAGMAAVVVTSPRMTRRVRLGFGAVALIALGAGPMIAILAAVAVAVIAIRRLRRRREAADAEHRGLVRLADLIALGLSSGLTLAASLQETLGELDEPLRGDVALLLRRSATSGIAVALATWEGRGRRLFRLMARAAMTGAPLIGAVEAFATEQRHAEHTRALAAARRLPVRLLLPLALLILPGFVILVVGPALARSLARLDVVP